MKSNKLLTVINLLDWGEMEESGQQKYGPSDNNHFIYYLKIDSANMTGIGYIRLYNNTICIIHAYDFLDFQTSNFDATVEIIDSDISEKINLIGDNGTVVITVFDNTVKAYYI